jgi:hypothetical protein
MSKSGQLQGAPLLATTIEPAMLPSSPSSLLAAPSAFDSRLMHPRQINPAAHLDRSHIHPEPVIIPEIDLIAINLLLDPLNG